MHERIRARNHAAERRQRACLEEVVLLLGAEGQAAADDLLRELAAQHRLHGRHLLVVAQVLVHQLLQRAWPGSEVRVRVRVVNPHCLHGQQLLAIAQALVRQLLHRAWSGSQVRVRVRVMNPHCLHGRQLLVIAQALVRQLLRRRG